MEILNQLPKLRCYCHHHCPPEAQEGICEVDIGGRCFAAAQETFNPETGFLEPEYSYGCFAPGDPTFLQCKGHLVDHNIPTSILCCDNESFCNEHLKPEYKATNLTEPFAPYNPPANYFLLQLLLAAVFSLLLLTFFVVLYIVCKYVEF